MLLSIVFLFGLLGLAGLSVTGRTLTAPDWVAERAVAHVNRSFEQGRVSLGRLTFHVDTRGVPRFAFRNVGLFDSAGVEVARLNEVGARVSLAALLRGRVEPEVLRLNGAQMTVRRSADGRFALSFGAREGASGTLPDVLDAIDQAFQTAPMSGVRLIEAGAMTITLEDARTGRFWQITDGSLQVKQDARSLDFSIAVDVFNGTEELASTVLGIHTDKRDSSASLGATFENAAAADIALQSPVLSFLGVLDAPISGAVRAEFGAAGALSSLVGSLEIAEGALQPTSETRPIGFDAAKAYFRYRPEKEVIQFSEVSIRSEAGSATGSGSAYLRDFVNGWPSALVGQFSLADLRVEPQGMFTEPVGFAAGAVDMRVQLSPFNVDIGQFMLREGSDTLRATANVSAGKDGWEARLDAEMNSIDRARLLTLWPVSFKPRTRSWFSENVAKGEISNISMAARIEPKESPRIGLAFDFADATIRYLKSQPLITDADGYAAVHDNSFAIALESGQVAAPSGGVIDLAGSTYRIGDTRKKPARATLALRGSSTITAALSLMNEPPFNILRNSDLPVDLASGRTRFTADVGFDMVRKVALPDVDYQVTADLNDVATGVLVKGRDLSADALTLTATPTAVRIGGPMQLGQAPLNVTWQRRAGPEQAGKTHVSGTLELSPATLEEFAIGLPAGSVTGTGEAQVDLELADGSAPQFSLTSDLKGIGLRIAALNWSKAPDATGNLTLTGTLGPTPAIETLEISGPGLTATGGKVDITPNGQLAAARFDRVTVGGWLDAPVTLTGRGQGQPPEVTVTGGTIDIRKAVIGSGGGQAQGGPVRLALDRLVVSEGIVLTGLTGQFDGAAGFAGTFTGRVNGGASVTGRLVPARNGTAIRIRGEDAGGVLRDAGVFRNAIGGGLDLTLRPRPERGVYIGQLQVDKTRVTGAPALTELLSAISIVGLLDQVNGPGIAFNQIDADFRLSPRAVTLTRSSATGPSLGVSLDGVYDLRTKQMDMQGVMSPVYFLNAIGQIFTRRGEGLFGFTFRLAGAADAPQVSVNPLSILTPGMFREIFRRPPPSKVQ